MARFLQGLQFEGIDHVPTTAEYDLGEFTFPRGWFMVVRSSDVDGAPAPLRMFGRELVT